MRISSDKTIMVQRDFYRLHPKYGRTLKRSSKVMVHDPNNLAHVGDVVLVNTCRPISKRKRNELREVLVKEPGVLHLARNPDLVVTASEQRQRRRDELLRRVGQDSDTLADVVSTARVMQQEQDLEHQQQPAGQ